MEKKFDPVQIESAWYARWEASGAFKPTGNGPPYCVLLPPPNVTGTLHMGHAFQLTLMDVLVRYQHMRGMKTLWQVGTDHAGIATQKIVENQLATEGKTRHDLGREPFIRQVWQWKEASGGAITHQMRRLGVAADWSRERFTMDEGLSAAVRRVFVQWYRAGLIYRGNRLVNWDPVLGTAVSDLEVDNVEHRGHMWSVSYPFMDSEESVVIATTRPETLLGDVAVAVHPDDARYTHLIGQRLILPITGRIIPLIADTQVARGFGTGCVKITPAHDFNDYAMGQRHDLTPINIFDKEARIIGGSDVFCPDTENLSFQPSVDDRVLARQAGIPERYWGLDRYDARRLILKELKAGDALVETRPHRLQIPVSQRSGAVIEPRLTDQWFVDLCCHQQADGRPGGWQAITRPALEAVRQGRIRFVPENWGTTYSQWLENIQDWCISRQLWWGHRIPAWYDEAGHLFVGEDEADARAHGSVAPVGALRQDSDVLDTWFSSALWPFSTLGWPLDGPVKNEQGVQVADWACDQIYLPSAVLVTGFDIIFFWVARMVMATLYFTGRIPFREVYINAIVRDAEGHKMSKSRGNTLDPLDLIDGIALKPLLAKSTRTLLLPQVLEKVAQHLNREYPEGIKAIGTDALRFTFVAMASYSRTVNFDLKRAGGYRAFCNKLWNAARFVLMRQPDSAPEVPPEPITQAERWILTRLKWVLTETEQHLTSYRFDHLAKALYEFVWNEYCDWFLELTKPALSGADPEAVASTHHTLLVVLEAVLRVLHPIMPFITEDIWQHVAPRLGLSEKSVYARPWPEARDFTSDEDAMAQIEWFKALLGGIRRIRSDMRIAPGRIVPLLLADGDHADNERVTRFTSQITFLAQVKTPQWLTASSQEPASATAVVGSLRVLIPMAGLIDPDAEKVRLGKEISRIESEIKKCQNKLSNARFVAHAPSSVVTQERQRLAHWRAQFTTLRAQHGKLAGNGAFLDPSGPEE